MASTSVEFGCYPHNLDISVGNLKIETLPQLREKVQKVKSSGCVESEWFYAPPATNHPYPSRIFELPKTHKIVGQGEHREEELHFYIWMLSFFSGMRFSYSEAGFLDSTPIVQGKLIDFFFRKQDIEKAVEKSIQFWNTNVAHSQKAQLVIAVLNSLYLSQYPKNLQFEEFSYLYFALDTCFKLTCELHGPVPRDKNTHAERIDWTCQKLGAVVPSWAIVKTTGNKKSTQISELRNNAMHEALFAGAPLGFGTLKSAARPPSGNLCLEMKKLVCRFLVSLVLGNTSDYVSSKVDDRMQHLLVI